MVIRSASEIATENHVVIGALGRRLAIATNPVEGESPSRAGSVWVATLVTTVAMETPSDRPPVTPNLVPDGRHGNERSAAPPAGRGFPVTQGRARVVTREMSVARDSM